MSFSACNIDFVPRGVGEAGGGVGCWAEVNVIYVCGTRLDPELGVERDKNEVVIRIKVEMNCERIMKENVSLSYHVLEIHHLLALADKFSSASSLLLIHYKGKCVCFLLINFCCCNRIMMSW